MDQVLRMVVQGTKYRALGAWRSVELGVGKGRLELPTPRSQSGCATTAPLPGSSKLLGGESDSRSDSTAETDSSKERGECEQSRERDCGGSAVVGAIGAAAFGFAIETQHFSCVSDFLFSLLFVLGPFFVCPFRGGGAFSGSGFVIFRANNKEFVEGTAIGVVRAGILGVRHIESVPIVPVLSAPRRSHIGRGLKFFRKGHAMRVVMCQELGPPEALVELDQPMPEPGAGQIRIAVRAAGVNYVDGLIAAGRYQVKVPVPFIPGSEIAGIVDALGAGVEEFVLGDRVFATMGVGGFAESVVTRATNVIKIPDSLDFARAASFHQSYCTAWFAFTRRTHIREGEFVVVTGAGGGVGLAAIDVARSFGGRVIAIASTPRKRELAMAMGAESVIDPTVEDVKSRCRELSDGGVDVVYDVVGGDTAEQCLRALKFDGRFCVVGFTAGIARVPLNLVLLNNRTLVGVEWGGWVMRNVQENAAMVRDVLGAIHAGKLQPIAPEERTLAQAGSAVSDLLERRAAGKIVLVP